MPLRNVATRWNPSAPESSPSKKLIVDGNRLGIRVTVPQIRADDSTT